ncbi:Ni,Fe-hydrogenase I cytochrome b subunit [hydrothermal vent metagenome]|uniref:Ni,Fe-hydrogenase I cytochrome b subunit n=1 Tax=hydrothermal vent metagenome TaxID=652676 RepID=A0A3B0S2B4_9ZZZZ
MTITNHETEVGRPGRPTEGLAQESAKESATVKVWDIAVRIFHWSLVISFVIAWITADEWDKVHEIAGYVIGGLLILRVIWGFVGSKHARFSDFIYKPTTVLAYLRDSLTRKAKRYIGHNPAGGAMAIALLVTLTAAIVSGIASTTNMFWGVEWMEELHELTANATLVLVFLHIVGVIYASYEHKENLVKSMITGFKRRLSS